MKAVLVLNILVHVKFCVVDWHGLGFWDWWSLVRDVLGHLGWEHSRVILVINQLLFTTIMWLSIRRRKCCLRFCHRLSRAWS